MKPINLYELINAALEAGNTELVQKEKTLLHKQPNNIVNFIQRILDEEIEKRTATEVERKGQGFNLVPAPHESEFFLPSDKLLEATKMFDECGKIEIVIRRNESGTKVHVNKLVSNIKLATLEDEMRAVQQGEPQDFDPELPLSLPQLQPGQEIVLPPPPRGSTRPTSPRAVPEKSHLPLKVDSPPQQEEHQKPVPALTMRAVSGLPVYIGLPTQGQFHWAVNYSIFGQLKRSLGHLKITNRIDIRQARNTIVQSFLKSDAEWLYMQDSDILAPFGNPGLFKEICGDRSLAFTPETTGLVAVEALINSGKSLIGGVYATRDGKRNIVCNLGMNPRDEKERLSISEIQRKGPKSGLLEVSWFGFGCVAIHRQVFTDIASRMPELVKTNGEPTDFFDFTGGGEDVTFQARAIKVGHHPYLNTAVWCAHLGQHAYLP